MTAIRSNILKVTADHANRCVHVGDKVITRPTLIRNYAHDLPNLVDFIPEHGRLCCPKTARGRRMSTGDKAFNRELTEYLGLPPKKWASVFNGVATSVWIRPIEWYVNRLARGMRGRVSLGQVEMIWQCKSILDQARSDGIAHIVPILLVEKAPPDAVKRKVGRSRWKRLAHNSFSRNALIARFGMESMDLPSTAIPYAAWADERALHWACNNRDCRLKDRQRLLALAHIYEDTYRMALRLGECFNDRWSLRRMLEEHDRLSKAITKGKYSDNPFDLYERVGDFCVKHQGWAAVWLKSPYEIAEEGNAMRHCVASYIPDACEGRYLVFSIRNVAGNRYSTLGVSVDCVDEGSSESFWLRPVQHLCAMNHPVEDQRALALADEAVSEFSKLLNRKRLSG